MPGAEYIPENSKSGDTKKGGGEARIALEGFIGVSDFCRRVRQNVATYASSTLPILIQGDTGTGKEVIAQALHNASDRRNASFLAVNCATLGGLAESELFGHTRGSFTGAQRSTRGYIGSAEGGTLLLDEVGELALEIQAKLLRFLDNGEYIRLGGSECRQGDVRILSASNRKLEVMSSQGSFRSDLFYRLSGAVIQMAPLRDRPEDVPLLARHFLKRFSVEMGQTCLMSPKAIMALCYFEWPGNVRQLRHMIHRLCQECSSREITEMDVASALGQKVDDQMHIDCYKTAKQKALQTFDRQYFTALLSATQGKLSDSLELSGMHKKNFYMKTAELGISPRDFRE